MTACGGTLGASGVWLATLATSKTCWSAADGRWFGFRPPRFAATYSQGRPRLAQRAQIGLSPEHFNFEKAQEWQLVRILTCSVTGAGVPARLERAGVGGDLRVVEDMTMDDVGDADQ